MANETTITVRGRAGTTPRLTEGHNGDWTSFRLATTPRYRAGNGEWRDGKTTWFTVHANGELAGRVADCVRSGAPLLVRGRVELVTYADREGATRSDLRLRADAVGLDIQTGGRIVWRAPARSDAGASDGTDGSDGSDGSDGTEGSGVKDVSGLEELPETADVDEAQGQGVDAEESVELADAEEIEEADLAVVPEPAF